ncbi:MAG TPA: Fur family transcriptional regulator [Chloroflexia bacterium]|nr:Fur family transcriptional regulator [Chloroflexia bacterium]
MTVRRNALNNRTAEPKTINTTPKPEAQEASLTDQYENLEISTRFLREREKQLDPQTLRLAQALVKAGFKVTEPRLAIIEEIVQYDHEFEINELVERLERYSGNKPGVASVFRTVKLLAEIGLLQRVHTGDGCHRYGLVRGHNHQIVCRCCDRTIDFGGCDFSALTEFLEKQSGYKLEGHWIEFFGLCPDCREATIDSKNSPDLPLKPLAPHSHTFQDEQARPAPLNVKPIL